MNMFGFGPMSSFFQDEFIFYDENEERRQRCRDDGDDDLYTYVTCPKCGDSVKYRYGAEKARCRDCGKKFRVDWFVLIAKNPLFSWDVIHLNPAI